MLAAAWLQAHIATMPIVPIPLAQAVYSEEQCRMGGGHSKFSMTNMETEKFKKQAKCGEPGGAWFREWNASFQNPSTYNKVKIRAVSDLEPKQFLSRIAVKHHIISQHP